MFTKLQAHTRGDTSIEWLGPLPKRWGVERGKSLFRRENREPLDDDGVVTCFRDGVVTLRSNRRLTGYTEAIHEHGYQRIQKGDLVIHAMDAFAGAVGVSDSDGKSSPVYSACTARGDANAHYYAAVVREMARTSWIAALSRGVRERSTDFRFESFANQILPVPPVDEQAAIVKYLGHAHTRIDRAIAAKRKLIALLEEQKQAIIHQAVTRGLDPSIPLKSSGITGLGDIPAHWEVFALKRGLRSLTDCEHKTAPHEDGTRYRVVRTSAVKNGELVVSGTYTTSLAGFLKWTTRAIPEPGDVIFTREAPAGEACIVPEGMDVCLGQRTVLMKPRSAALTPEWIVNSIYHGPARQEISVATQGSTVGHFNMDEIARLPICVPPRSEQESIAAHIKLETAPMTEAMGRVSQEIELLREFRARLTSDVVTGQVDVREIAATLPELTDDVLGSADDDLDDVDEIIESEVEFPGSDE